MGRKISLSLLLAFLIAVLVPQTVFADVAPPDYPPGSTVGTESATNVQMVSETVSIAIEASDETVSDFIGLAADHIVGHVEATFNMVNQGSDAESLEVWFPLGVPNGFDEITQVQNFAVWVNEEPVTPGQTEVPGQWDYLVPRAIWNVTFPPGETVVLRVTYDMYPVGYSPYGTFSYILETGAGWAGNIGQGTVTVSLPYPINRFNVPQNTNTSYSPFPAGYTIDGDTLVWEFTDLEPTAANNIMVTVLEPDRWMRIANAEANVAANPDSAEAHFELAQARADALSFKYGLNNYGDSFELSDLARAEYEQAIALDSQNVAIRVAYLDLLNQLWFPTDPAMDWATIYTNLEAGLSMDPNNEQLLWALQTALYSLESALEISPDNTDLQAMHEDMQSWLDNPPAADMPVPTVEQQMATPVPTAQPEPQLTAVPTAVPPSPVPTPIAAETRRVCPGAAVLLLVPLGLVWRHRRE